MTRDIVGSSKSQRWVDRSDDWIQVDGVVQMGQDVAHAAAEFPKK
jgi:hypothetical protein